MEKKLTNSGPFMESTSKHSIYTHTVAQVVNASNDTRRHLPG